MSNDQQGPDAGAESEPGYAEQAGYAQQPGYAQEQGYAQPQHTAQPQGYPQPQGYAQQPTYAQPTGYAQPGAYGQRPTSTDGFSITALVTGILGFGVIPIVFGILGLKRTRANGTSGRGLAIAGIVLGALVTLFWGLFIALVLIAGVGTATFDLGDTQSELSVGEPSAEPTAASEETSDETGVETGLTPLLDVAPLEVAGFATDGFVPQDALVAAGALESYTASYTDGTSVVEVFLTDWTTEAEGEAWATTQDAAFTPDQLVDQGDGGDEVAYRIYEVGDVTTIVATNYTAALTLRGPHDAVIAIYLDYPL
ncbi:DUF4190 domain-containing protein [Pengzhenrongella frigida]|uniref:DUF4190 domain-containing protein n=1 Tax=Pengzhenrongella frigida TaxID=1259133 RepID=UPI0013ED2ACF|nr:DUF4190 domain-containing protein [Cellulomonas sp. HLT2-17]